MSRSLKKGPYINVALEKKILAMNESGKKSVVKTWARASMISPDFVGHTVAVHNGNKFIPVYITENMVENRKKWEQENISRLKKEKQPVGHSILQSSTVFLPLRARCAMSLTLFAAWR